jgi:uncharacterized RDD family membrane protein YckC
LQLDTIRAVETPEGIQLELRVAGPLVRCLAWAIDMALRITLYLGLSTALAFFGNVGLGIFLIGLFLIEWFYPVLFEVYNQGQSLGKRVMGLRVLNDDGTPVGWGGAMVRSLVMFVDLLPMLYGAGLLSMLFNKDGKRLGDLTAGTLVVYVEPKSIPNKPVLGLPPAFPLPPPVPLGLQEQRAIASFDERRTALTQERAQELANLLEPLTGATGSAAVERIRSMASALTGKAP